MDSLVITQAIAVVLYLLKDKKRAKQWMPAIRKIRDACSVVIGD